MADSLRTGPGRRPETGIVVNRTLSRAYIGAAAMGMTLIRASRIVHADTAGKIRTSCRATCCRLLHIHSFQIVVIFQPLQQNVCRGFQRNPLLILFAPSNH